MTTSPSRALDHKPLVDAAEAAVSDGPLEQKAAVAPQRSEGAPQPLPVTFAARGIITLLCISPVVATLAYGAVDGWALALFFTGAMLIAVLWLVDGLLQGDLRYSNSLLQLPLIGTFLLGLIQLLPLRTLQHLPNLSAAVSHSLSLDQFGTQTALIQLAALSIYFAAALAFIDTHKRVRLLVRTFVLLGAGIALLGLLQFFISPTRIYGIREPIQALPFGPFVDRNHFAALMHMLVMLPIALLIGGATTGDRKPLYIFATLLMLVAQVMTGSRAGLLSLTAALLFLVCINLFARKDVSAEHERGKSTVRKIVLTGLVGAVILAGVLVALVALGNLDPLRRITGASVAEDTTAGGRLDYWRTTLSIVRANPLIGVGLNAYGVAFTQYDSLNGTYRVERAHNEYLQVLAETGIIGAALSALFIVLLFRMTWSCRNSAHDRTRLAAANGAIAGCLGVLVHSCFEFPLHTPSNALVFVLLAVLAVANVHHVRHRQHRHAAA